MDNGKSLGQARELQQTVRLIQRRFARLYAQRRRSSEAAPICELTFPQLNAMHVVRERFEITIKDLAEVLQVSAPSASSMVDRLVNLGMLEREHSQKDRRVVLVRLSAEGDRNLYDQDDHMLRSIVVLLERLGPEHSQQWLEVCQRIREILEAGDLAPAMSGASIKEEQT